MNGNSEIALIALGSNIPIRARTPLETLAAALAALPEGGESLVAQSRFFATPCFPAGAGPDYVNAVAALRTARDARGLLDRLHAVEAAFGRERQERWGNRTLDLDLLALGDRVLPDRETWDRWAGLAPEAQRLRAPDRLILPHPRLHERAFVLVPLLDIAPRWRHPVLGRTAAELAANLPDRDKRAIKPL